MSTSPLRDESQLTDERIAEIAEQQDSYPHIPFARAIEAEVRSLRSPGWIHPVVHETLQREADRLNNELASLRSQGEPEDEDCPRCKGSEIRGFQRGVKCTLCDGSGYASPPSQPIASDVVAEETVVCPNCNRTQVKSDYDASAKQCIDCFPDALSRHGSVEADTHRSTRNTGPCAGCDLENGCPEYCYCGEPVASDRLKDVRFAFMSEADERKAFEKWTNSPEVRRIIVGPWDAWLFRAALSPNGLT